MLRAGSVQAVREVTHGTDDLLWPQTTTSTSHLSTTSVADELSRCSRLAARQRLLRRGPVTSVYTQYGHPWWIVVLVSCVFEHPAHDFCANETLGWQSTRPHLATTSRQSRGARDLSENDQHYDRRRHKLQGENSEVWELMCVCMWERVRSETEVSTLPYWQCG